jgi:hypothetical protein
VERELGERDGKVYRLSDQERTAVRAGMDDARRGNFGSFEEIEELYRSHRRSGAGA